MRALWWMCLLADAAVAAPIELLHQGRLLDALGAPVSGTVPVAVSLWDHETSTDPTDRLWTSTYAAEVEHGFFSVRLGAGTDPALDAAWFTAPLWVELSAAGVTSRQALVSVPRAASAHTSEHVLVVADLGASGCTDEGAIRFDRAAGGLRVCVDGGWVTAGATDGPQVLKRQTHEILGITTIGAGNFPFDGSVPLLTEGNPVWDVTFTPTSSTSTVEIEALLHISSPRSGGDNYVAALFLGSGTNAVRSGIGFGAGNRAEPVTVRHEFAPGSTAPIRIRVRAGGNGGSTCSLNGHDTSVTYGGTVSSWLKITERE